MKKNFVIFLALILALGMVGCTTARNDFGLSEEQQKEMSVLNLKYGVYDVDTCILLGDEGYAYGSGSDDRFMGLPADLERKVIEHHDWEPTYKLQDYWYAVRYDGLYATCYYSASAKKGTVSSVTTTRPEARTYRGIKIGSTRDQVKEAYPSSCLYTEELSKFKGDYIFFNKNGKEGKGISLIFWFKDDKVVKMMSYYAL